MSPLPRLAVLACAALAVGLTHCGGDDDAEAGEVECPPGGTQLTEQNFGREFLDTYCTRCHSSQLTGPARQGAPVGDDWDRMDLVRDEAGEINELAGAHADGSVNRTMPPSDPRPSDEERRQLAEWLACGAP